VALATVLGAAAMLPAGAQAGLLVPHTAPTRSVEVQSGAPEPSPAPATPPSAPSSAVEPDPKFAPSSASSPSPAADQSPAPEPQGSAPSTLPPPTDSQLGPWDPWCSWTCKAAWRNYYDAFLELLDIETTVPDEEIVALQPQCSEITDVWVKCGEQESGSEGDNPDGGGPAP
jgi:hypothetical protein